MTSCLKIEHREQEKGRCPGLPEGILGKTDALDSEIDQQNVRDLYFSFGVVLVALLWLIIVPLIAIRIGSGQWRVQMHFADTMQGLEAHGWLAVGSLFVLAIQVSTGPLLNRETFGKILKPIHTIVGWVGLATFGALAISGCIITLNYWNNADNKFVNFGQFIFGVMYVAMVAGAVTAVKMGHVDVHKDVMFGVISWAFFGAGATRWLGVFLRHLSGDRFGPNIDTTLSNAQNALNFCVFQPLLLGVVYYRAKRLTKWWNILIIAGSFISAISAFIGNAISYHPYSSCGA